MEDTVKYLPHGDQNILEQTSKIGFDQRSEPLLGLFLASLTATKPGGNFLEPGTGSGLSTAWPTGIILCTKKNH